MKVAGRGFTIIEILITLIVMAGLLALGTLAVGKMLAQARDRERESDIKVFANGLEARYNNGNSTLISSPGGDGKAGSYPSTDEMQHIAGTTMTGWNPASVSGGYLYAVLVGTSSSTFTSPTNNQYSLICTASCAAANDATQLNTAMSVDRYVYAPANAAGGVCTSGTCVNYTLYWRSEIDGQIKSLASKHR